MLGNVVRWLSCDPPPFFLCHPFRPQPPCFCRKHTLPVPFPARSLPLPSSAHRHSLCCPGSARCRKAAPGTRGTWRRAGQGWGEKRELRQRNSEEVDEACGHWGWGEGVAGLQPGSVPAHSSILYQKTCRRDTPLAPRPPSSAGHTVLPTGQEAGGAGREGNWRARPGGCPGISRQTPNPSSKAQFSILSNQKA